MHVSTSEGNRKRTQSPPAATTSTSIVVGSGPDNHRYLAVVRFQAVSDRDSDALAAVLNTLNAIGNI